MTPKWRRIGRSSPNSWASCNANQEDSVFRNEEFYSIISFLFSAFQKAIFSSLNEDLSSMSSLVFSRNYFPRISRKLRPGFHHIEKLAEEHILCKEKGTHRTIFKFPAFLTDKFIYFQGHHGRKEVIRGTRTSQSGTGWTNTTRKNDQMYYINL